MQTILGSGGAIGRELAKALKEHSDQIRLVSRYPEKVNPGDELYSADLMDPKALREAVRGSKVVYITIGFEYSIKSWKANWPPFIKSAITACKDEGCKLVFFDNIYMYDQDHLLNMDENTPIHPPSQKGAVRREIADMLLKEMTAGDLDVLIARCADYYGPGIKNTSMLTETVLNNLSAGKKANWLGSADYKHSFTHIQDAGIATALLGNTPEAFGQVWHLPTAADPPTGREWVELIAKEMGVKPRLQVAPKFMVRILGLFVPIMKEMVEMIYQYERDYVFDSSKFEKQFDYSPISYSEGIRALVQEDYSKSQ